MAEFDPDAYLARTEKRKERTTNSSFDPDAYLKKTAPETALQTFGRSSASLADSALNTLTGTLDYGAYALARAAGLSPEQATAETTSPKDVVGRAFGVAGTPGYENAPLRQAGTAIGQNLQSSVIEPIAETTGLPQQDVGNMLNTAMMGAGPAVPKVARAAKAVGTGAVDVVGGAAGAFGGDIAKPGRAPRPGQTASVRQPVGETYIPADVLEQYRAGTITAEQAQAQALPTSGLPQSALARTGGTVPYQGQGMRAFGEKIGQDYRNPYWLGAEVAGDFLLGGLPTAARLGYKAYQGVQGARAASQLEKLGFTPLTPAEAQAFKNVPGPVSPGAASVTPQAQQALTPNYLPALPAPGVPSTIPMGGPGRNVNIEGQSYQLPYQIDTSNSQAARPVSPADIARQTAASKVQGAAPGQSVQEIAASKITPRPEQQAMLDQIRARGEAQKAADLAAKQQRWAAAGVKLPQGTELPPAPAPAPAPVVETPAVGLEALRSKIKPQTPEERAAVDSYMALNKTEKAAQTRAENKKKEPIETSPKQAVSIPSTGKTKVLGPRAAKEAIAAADAAGEKYNISYKKGDGEITVRGGDINFKLDPELKLKKMTTNSLDSSGVGEGIYQGQPVTLEVNLKTGKAKLYNSNRRLLKTYGK